MGIQGEAQLTEKEIHDRDIAWLKSCDGTYDIIWHDALSILPLIH